MVTYQTFKSSLKNVLSSESFIEKFILLLITAIISGLLIPYVANNIQKRSSKNQAVLDSQSRLFDDISHVIITSETLLLDISFFKSDSTVFNDSLHEKAFNSYSTRFPDLLSQLRTQTVKAQTLASIGVTQKLLNFQFRIINEQDKLVNELYLKRNATISDWSECHKKNNAMMQEAQNLLYELAIDLNITMSGTETKKKQYPSIP